MIDIGDVQRMTAMTMCIFNLESWPKLMAGYKPRVSNILKLYNARQL